jgi:hypothetical protein
MAPFYLIGAAEKQMLMTVDPCNLLSKGLLMSTKLNILFGVRQNVKLLKLHGAIFI